MTEKRTVPFKRKPSAYRGEWVQVAWVMGLFGKADHWEIHVLVSGGAFEEIEPEDFSVEEVDLLMSELEEAKRIYREL